MSAINAQQPVCVKCLALATGAGWRCRACGVAYCANCARSVLALPGHQNPVCVSCNQREGFDSASSGLTTVSGQEFWRVIPEQQRFDVCLCYFFTPLLPLVVLLLRSGEGQRCVRFDAIQAILLAPLVLVPYVIALIIPLIWIIAATALFGRGVRLPLVGALARAAAWGT